MCFFIDVCNVVQCCAMLCNVVQWNVVQCCAMLWLCCGCVVAVLWLCCGCVVAVLWLCCGCVVAMFVCLYLLCCSYISCSHQVIVIGGLVQVLNNSVWVGVNGQLRYHMFR
jgi:hypothetical protein